MRVAIAVGLVAALVGDIPRAEACGCLSPPAVTEGDYAVNQEAEQIIFESDEPGWVTAHVLIRYVGDPAQFAWIVPVPEVPELDVSPTSTFALLDQLTAPQINITTENICPQSEWQCRYHSAPVCGGGDDNGSFPGLADAGAGAGDAPPGGSAPPVTVISQQTVGDYQTVTFRASEASAAVQWLRDNGFIVNQTTSIYMESYVAANMVFVAAKLVPGAGVSAIKPLKLRYRAAYPTVPLILTAVAAEPNLTVNTFIYGHTPFRPLGHPVITIDPNRLASDRLGRSNYPMVLSRTIDEAGGDGFAIEYRGYPVTSQIGQTYCCLSGVDYCGVENNGQCECPGTDFDAADCQAVGDLPAGLQMLTDLSTKYGFLTRITTRVSPEEMTFDPAFEADDTSPTLFGNLYVNGTQPSLNACGAAVLDQAKLRAIDEAQQCASLYCGPHGQCVVTGSGPACQCAEGFVAQQFTDMDAQPSVTCVPRVPPVDLRADGIQLPDGCAGISCGAGQCIDRNGEPVCACDSGNAAIAGLTAPSCAAVTSLSGSPGAQDFSEELRTLKVCAPRPPACGPDGWLEKGGTLYPGVDCGDSQPDPALTREPPKPTCPGLFGCDGCDTPGSSAPIGGIAAAWLVALVIFRRRRA